AASAATDAEIAAAASPGTMPTRAWARASAASTSAQRTRKASSPNAARIAAVPNISPNRVAESIPMVMNLNPRRQEDEIAADLYNQPDHARATAGLVPEAPLTPSCTPYLPG